ncbi:MAG: hypothetical protein A2464_01305 [Deltaproteobacteria bacterium RIFOXYC2_FULL_48_10]|nr:MAG: hypothetical protein A2464_01305 [Deltaproteobacteria bacterium RIFOXYC2_FULL_48_10]
MAKPYGRKTKLEVGTILAEKDRATAFEKLARIPDEQLVGHLFSYFYNMDPLIKFRSASAMGSLVARMAEQNMERARIVLRRIMWNLNDESGGIGWGSPEAMGEILALSPELALEFKSILFSYLDPGGNFIEHEILQQGVLWGIGTYLEAHPRDLNEKTRAMLYCYLHSEDPIKRAYAFRALGYARSFLCCLVPDPIRTDDRRVNLFNGWDFSEIRISDLAKSNDGEKILPDKSCGMLIETFPRKMG